MNDVKTFRTSHFWCHECKAWLPCNSTDDGSYHCVACTATILCDDCGQPWSDDHACELPDTIASPDLCPECREVLRVNVRPHGNGYISVWRSCRVCEWREEETTEHEDA